MKATARHPGRKIKVTARLKDRHTGEIKDYVYESTNDNIAWQWTEGNYSCDCNRSIAFYGLTLDNKAVLSCSGDENRIELVSLRY